MGHSVLRVTSIYHPNKLTHHCKMDNKKRIVEYFIHDKFRGLFLCPFHTWHRMFPTKEVHCNYMYSWKSILSDQCFPECEIALLHHRCRVFAVNRYRVPFVNKCRVFVNNAIRPLITSLFNYTIQNQPQLENLTTTTSTYFFFFSTHRIINCQSR